MTFALVLAGLVVLALIAGWLIDRRAARHGYRIDMRQVGLRRQVSYTRVDDGTPVEDHHRPGRGDLPADPRSR